MASTEHPEESPTISRPLLAVPWIQTSFVFHLWSLESSFGLARVKPVEEGWEIKRVVHCVSIYICACARIAHVPWPQGVQVCQRFAWVVRVSNPRTLFRGCFFSPISPYPFYCFVSVMGACFLPSATNWLFIDLKTVSDWCMGLGSYHILIRKNFDSLWSKLS